MVYELNKKEHKEHRQTWDTHLTMEWNKKGNVLELYVEHKNLYYLFQQLV